MIKKTRERFIARVKEIIKFIPTTLGTNILVYMPREWKERIETGKVVYEK